MTNIVDQSYYSNKAEQSMGVEAGFMFGGFKVYFFVFVFIFVLFLFLFLSFINFFIKHSFFFHRLEEMLVLIMTKNTFNMIHPPSPNSMFMVVSTNIIL